MSSMWLVAEHAVSKRPAPYLRELPADYSPRRRSAIIRPPARNGAAAPAARRTCGGIRCLAQGLELCLAAALPLSA